MTRESIQCREIGDALRFREHHGAIRTRTHGFDVGDVVQGARRIDAHDHACRVQRGAEYGLARGRTGGRIDGVLEVEDDRIRALQGFREAVRPVGRAEQERRAPGEVGHAPPIASACASWHHISTERVAFATTTPSWLRPVCSMVTIPCPGRDDESRFAVTTVSE